MRKEVQKFLFIGAQEDRQGFFAEAQQRGFIHFIDKQKKTGRWNGSEEALLLQKAIRILRKWPPVEQEESTEGVDALSLARQLVELDEKKERLEEEIQGIHSEMERIRGFGRFSLRDVAWIQKESGLHIQFFVAKADLFANVPIPDSCLFLHEEQGLDYYVSLAFQPALYPKMVEITWTTSLTELKTKELALLHALRVVEETLKKQAKYSAFLHVAFVEQLNLFHVQEVNQAVSLPLEGSLFAIDGWVPVTRVHEVEECCKAWRIHAEEIAVEAGDEVPTYLENAGLSRLGEDLVGIYDTPSASDVDPSPWVLFAFTLFFAFIIGDAGYGLLYLSIALFLRYRFPQWDGLKKRVLNLFTVLSLGCIAWGVLMTSFFGMQIAKDNPLRKVSFLQWVVEKKGAYHFAKQDGIYQELNRKYPSAQAAQEAHAWLTWEVEGKEVVFSKLSDHVMFELALFVGIVHLMASMLRYATRNPSLVGWFFFLLGAYLYFASYLQAPTWLNYLLGIDLVKGGEVGLQILLGGIGFAWLVAIWKHGWTGIFEIMNLVQVFADTLSYLRLYALGLAGAIVAGTINEIAASLPFLAALLLTIVSHLINLVLSTMSGVIHGLRLNFLEWYHYSFEGGGKKFQPLKKLVYRRDA